MEGGQARAEPPKSFNTRSNLRFRNIASGVTPKLLQLSERWSERRRVPWIGA